MIAASVSVSLGNLAGIAVVAAISVVVGGLIGAFFGYLSAWLVLQRQRAR